MKETLFMPGQIWIPAADNNVNEALAGGCPLSLLLAFHQSTSTAAAAGMG
jgi:hypothetical protein